ncbi:hypothetical protein PENTCL1PPCAC_9555 [Pristionchus entomophagus]|uniref:Protein CDV3 homolog n=1 Tax=Pristionchus entomophagus TaxID=358040 RepID=A0AAV5SW75_9BILA|nr:hypothetical protein PENTCL1PPCAC_9555 [Pristionchus entomophagus]
MADLDSFFAKKKDKKKKTVVKVDDVGSLLERKAKKQEEREREETEDQKNGDDDRSQEESEWLDYETNTNNRVDGLRIKDMGIEEQEEEVPEPVEGEEKEVVKEVTKTWGTIEKNETAPELIPTASEFAAAKSSRYIAPSLRGGGSGPGGKIDLTNQEMFPTFAAAEQIEKHKKDEVKTGAWSTATAPSTRTGAYAAPRSDPWGSARPAGGDRERNAALDAVRAMSATANAAPAPVRPPHPVEPVLNKSANAYVPPHLRNQ